MELENMKFEIEIVKDDNLPKGTLYISTECGSGAKYQVDTADDVGKIVVQYIKEYCIAITAP